MSYHDILAAVAIRTNALVGTLAPALQTNFNIRPLTTTQFQSTVFPFSACQDAILYAEEKLAHVIANTENHPWRRELHGVSGGIGNEGLLSAFSTLVHEIIGVYGSVYDTTDGTVCTEKPLAVIRRRVRNAASFPTGSNIYHYHFEGNRIYHTRTSVTVDVCVYDRDDQISSIDSDLDTLLPGALEEAYICGAVSYLIRDDEFTGQASVYRQYFNDTLEMIRAGFTAVPNKPKAVAA